MKLSEPSDRVWGKTIPIENLNKEKNPSSLWTVFSPTAGITPKSHSLSTSIFLLTKVPRGYHQKRSPTTPANPRLREARLIQSELSYSRSASKEANHSTSTKKASLRQRRQLRPRQSPLFRLSDIVRSRFAPLPNRSLARNALFHAVRGLNGPPRCVPWTLPARRAL